MKDRQVLGNDYYFLKLIMWQMLQLIFLIFVDEASHHILDT